MKRGCGGGVMLECIRLAVCSAARLISARVSSSPPLRALPCALPGPGQVSDANFFRCYGCVPTRQSPLVSGAGTALLLLFAGSFGRGLRLRLLLPA
ncbi:uncharacterized protein K452DRAFT_291248 [Aplosporella prunicola CBS 121167]|uniref:Uncharacterized protein n=1 Tax=Aplosporella prunicola CBS 121167 TaxID=1176127 RepID=A0A6A6B3Q3_9PEZI|nr:uncharacterized protein K452DRAFT_291248 [Aplosporella prunicola CBS 121167]KAF2137895.1 hypothetical protein K452DRAFT_291248 [Aplosporella prunicola CBS 121167]